MLVPLYPRPSFLSLCLSTTPATHPSAVLLSSSPRTRFHLPLSLDISPVHPRHYRVFTVFCLYRLVILCGRERNGSFAPSTLRERDVGTFANSCARFCPEWSTNMLIFSFICVLYDIFSIITKYENLCKLDMRIQINIFCKISIWNREREIRTLKHLIRFSFILIIILLIIIISGFYILH